MPDFVYVLIKNYGPYDGQEIVDVYLSAEKAIETAAYINKEEQTDIYQVEQHRMIK